MHAGDRAGALDLLEANMAISRETGITFFGPAMLGAIALASDDPKRREEALREAQTILDRGCVSQNYFRFYRDAIEVSLAMNEWDQADLYATALEKYFHDEPMSWPSFIIARGRALADFGRGRGGEATLAQIRQLHAEATRLTMRSEQTRLEAALRLTPT